MEPDIKGVGALLIHEGTFLLQLRDDKQGITNPNLWGLVGGGIDEGESFEEAMRRECKEEIGIIPAGLTYLGHSDVAARFYAYLTDDEVERLALGEGQAIGFFTPKEISEMYTTPKVQAFFANYREAVERFVRREQVSWKDLDLKRDYPVAPPTP
ncbi:MAG: NUDIX domain-containing protein [Patescibacteria group bacterium]